MEPMPEPTLSADCPACGVVMALPDDVVTGEILFCDNCGVELELISLAPPALEFFEEEEK